MLVTLVYPILDAVLIFPAVLIFWGARRVSSKRIDTVHGQKMELKTEGDEVPSPVAMSSIWILLLSIAMILSALGDTGFAYSTAYGSDTVEREVWIWNIFLQ